MLIRRLAVIGLGLIGGSFARAVKRAGVVGHVTGYDRDAEELLAAERLGVVDSASPGIAAAVKAADVVVIAVPLGAMASVFQELAAALAPTAIVTDVGSAKVQVIKEAEAALGAGFARFVPGHPIAGREQNGVAASRGDLFQQHRVILTPVPETDPAALDFVRALWAAVGAEVELMDPQGHDDVLAATSHLPHVLAYSLVYTLSQLDESGAIFRFAAGGFADFTRIASSRPEVWRDIMFANADSILETIRLFDQDLQQLAQAIEQRNGAALLQILQQAKQARDVFAAQRTSTDASAKEANKS